MRIRGKKLMAIMLSAVLTLSIVPFIGTSSVVQAAEEKTVESLGTGVMAPPIQTTARYTKWRGSFVYYGKYDGEPVKIDKPDNLGVTGDCNWNFDDSTGTLTISGNGTMGDYELFSSPWYDFALYIKIL